MALAALAPLERRADQEYARGGLFEQFPVGLLKIDPSVQGSLNEAWADKIAQTWRDESYGVLEVSYRDGSYFVTNGQHRLVAARKRGIRHLRVHVLVNQNTQEEAIDWVIGNLYIKGKTSADRFRMNLQARDPDTLAVERICSELGVRIAFAGFDAPGATRAYATLQRLANKSDRLLRETLAACGAAWPEDKQAYSSRVLRAVGEFIHVYRAHPKYSSARLAKALGAFAANTVVQRLTSAGASGGGGGVSGRDVVLALYNRGLRGNDLPTATQSDLKRIALGQNPWANE